MRIPQGSLGTGTQRWPFQLSENSTGTRFLPQTVHSLLTFFTLSPTWGHKGCLGRWTPTGLCWASQQAVFALVLLLPFPRIIQKNNLRQGKGQRKKKLRRAGSEWGCMVGQKQGNGQHTWNRKFKTRFLFFSMGFS